MNVELPEGWTRTTLREVCIHCESINPAFSPTTQFTYFDIGGIDNEKNRVAEVRSFLGKDAPGRARQIVKKGDILFSTVRTYLRKIARVEHDYPNPVASTGFAVVRPSEEISADFLFFQMLSEQFLSPLHALQTGSSYPAVRERDIFDQPILVPPLPEQKRIAAKLSAKFSGLERAEAAAIRAQKRLHSYRMALIDSAVAGQLSASWRNSSKKMAEAYKGSEELRRLLLEERRSRWEVSELRKLELSKNPPKNNAWRSRYRDPVLPAITEPTHDGPGWVNLSLDQLGWSSGYGTSAKCTFDGQGPGVLRIPNIRDGKIDLHDLKYAADGTSFNDTDYVAPGDLLLIRTNGSKELIGRIAVISSKLTKECSFASYLIRFRLVGTPTLWSWVSLIWNSTILRAAIEARAATTAGQYNVSLSGLADLAIPLPSQEEQAEIVSVLEKRLRAANSLAEVIATQIERTAAVRRSLLDEALTGALIARDASDEPSTILLARIRAQLTSQPSLTKGKRMSKSKTGLVTSRKALIQTLTDHGQAMTPAQLFEQSGYQKVFTDSECDQAIIDQFYEELRRHAGPSGQIVEKRVGEDGVVLELKI